MSRSRVEQERLALASLADVLTSNLPADAPQAKIWLDWARSSGVFDRGTLSNKNRWQDFSQALGAALARPSAATQPTPSMEAFLLWARTKALSADTEAAFRVQAAHACLLRDHGGAFQAAFDFLAALPQTNAVPKDDPWRSLESIKKLRSRGMDSTSVQDAIAKDPMCCAFLLRCAMADARQSAGADADLDVIKAIAQASPKFVVQRAFCNLVHTGRLGLSRAPSGEPSPGFEAIADALLAHGASWTEPVSNSSKMSILKDPSPARQCLQSRASHPATPWAFKAAGAQAFWAMAQEEFAERLQKEVDQRLGFSPSEAASMAENLRGCEGMPEDFALKLLQVASLAAPQGRPAVLTQAFEALSDRVGPRKNPWTLPGFACPSRDPRDALARFKSNGWPTNDHPLPSSDMGAWWSESRSRSSLWQRQADEPKACAEIFLDLMARHGFGFPWDRASDADFDAIHFPQHRAVLEGWKIGSGACPAPSRPAHAVRI